MGIEGGFTQRIGGGLTLTATQMAIEGGFTKIIEGGLTFNGNPPLRAIGSGCDRAGG